MPTSLPTLTQTHPEPRDIPWEPGEPILRALYAHRPGTVRLSMIRSADGAVAGPDGSSRSLNGPADLRILKVVRACADVVVVGAQTARAERYGDIVLPADLDDARSVLGLAPHVHLAIVTGSGNIPAGLTAERTWIVTTARSRAARELPEQWRERLIIAGVDQFEPPLLVSQLRAQGLSRVVCEGGAHIAQRFALTDALNEWCVTTSPHRGGADSPPVPTVDDELALAHRLTSDGFTMERWA